MSGALRGVPPYGESEQMPYLLLRSSLLVLTLAVLGAAALANVTAAADTRLGRTADSSKTVVISMASPAEFQTGLDVQVVAVGQDSTHLGDLTVVFNAGRSRLTGVRLGLLVTDANNGRVVATRTGDWQETDIKAGGLDFVRERSWPRAELIRDTMADGGRFVATVGIVGTRSADGSTYAWELERMETFATGNAALEDRYSRLDPGNIVRVILEADAAEPEASNALVAGGHYTCYDDPFSRGFCSMTSLTRCRIVRCSTSNCPNQSCFWTGTEPAPEPQQ